MNNLDFKDISNARISSRMKQVVVLVIAIIIGMIISVSVSAQDSSRKKVRHLKTKIKTEVRQGVTACDQVIKKDIRPKVDAALPRIESEIKSQKQKLQ